MAQARFICQTGRVVGGSAAAVRDPLWRLVGANNRELGRMPTPAPDGLSCHDAVALLRSGLDRATPRIRLTGPGSSWAWVLEVDDRAVAVSGRRYLRLRECQYSLAQFLAAAVDAAVNDAH